MVAQHKKSLDAQIQAASSQSLVCQSNIRSQQEENSKCYFHVTLMENVPSIQINGLIPSIGDRSQEFGETEAVSFLFPSEEDMENALSNWLGDWYVCNYGDDCALAILHIHLPHDFPVFDNGSGFEFISKTTIPPECISFFDEEGNKIATQPHDCSLENMIQSARLLSSENYIETQLTPSESKAKKISHL